MSFRGDDGPQGPTFGAPPPSAEFMDFIDHINGVEAITVTGPDGKKRREQRRLPRTPEEERIFLPAQQLLARAINNVSRLGEYNVNAVVPFMPFIDTFTNLNAERSESLAQIADLGNIQQDIQRFRDYQHVLDDEFFDKQKMGLEENLARKGWANSTSGQEARALQGRNEFLGRKESEFKANVYGQDAAAKTLARNTGVFNLQESGRNSRLDEAKTKLALEQEQLASLDARRANYIGENANLLNVGGAIVGADQNKAQGSRATDVVTQTLGMQNADSLARYNANVNAQLGAHQAALASYDRRAPSFTDFALQAGGALGGAMLTGSPGSLGGRLGSKFSSFVGI